MNERAYINVSLLYTHPIPIGNVQKETAVRLAGVKRRVKQEKSVAWVQINLE